MAFRDYKKEVELIGGLNIVDVARCLGLSVTTKGKENVIHCPSPAHTDKNPSCALYVGRHGGWVFYCRSCGFKGNAYKLIQTVEQNKKPCDWAVGVGLIQAQEKDGKATYNKTVIANPQKSQQPPISPKFEAGHFDNVYRYFLDLLPDINKNHYLVEKRGLNLDILKENHVKNLNKDYKKELLNKFNEQTLLDSGLLARSKTKGTVYFNFFMCNSIFPYLVDGKIVYMQGRVKKPVPKKTKYISLAREFTTPFYTPMLANTKDVFVCEGAITALSFRQKNNNAIALISGNIVNNERLMMQGLTPLKNRRFRLSPDIDKQAGRVAMLKIITIFKKYKIEYDSEYFNVRDIARATGHTEGILKIKDYNDLMLFMERLEANE